MIWFWYIFQKILSTTLVRHWDKLPPALHITCFPKKDIILCFNQWETRNWEADQSESRKMTFSSVNKATTDRRHTRSSAKKLINFYIICRINGLLDRLWNMKVLNSRAKSLQFAMTVNIIVCYWLMLIWNTHIWIWT